MSRTKISRFICFALASVLTTAAVRAQSVEALTIPEYVRPDLSGVPPVQLDIWQKSGPLGVSLVRPDPNGIEIQMRDGQGSVVVFWEFMEEFNISLPQNDAMMNAFAITDAGIRAERLAPMIEPLFPVASIPPKSTNIHDLVDRYLQTLVEAKRWSTLNELSNRMYLDRIPAGSVGYFFTAVEELFLQGDEDTALALLNQLIAARPIEESKVVTLGIAAEFMKERLFSPALRLFQTYVPHTSGLEGKRIRLICAYLHLELGNERQSSRFMDRAAAIEGGDLTIQAVQRLIEGVRGHKSGEYDLALNHIGFALSILPPGDSLRVVALYYNYRTYEKLEKTAIADSILKEMQLLFGNSKYTTEISGPSRENADGPEAPAEQSSRKLKANTQS